MDSLSKAGHVVVTVIGTIAIVGAATTGIIVKAVKKKAKDNAENSPAKQENSEEVEKES